MEEDSKHPDVASIFTRLLAELNVSPTQLAKSLDPPTTQQAIQTYTSGKSKPGSKVLTAILKKYPALNAVWLMTGEGEPFPNGRFGEKKAEPFLPGGKVNSFGATEFADGELEGMLGENFGEDTGKPMHVGKPVKTQADYIQKLTAEADSNKAQAQTLRVVNAEQKETIKSMQKTIDFLQNAVEFLQGQVEQLQVAGKIDGNHYDAPGTYAVAEPVNPIGFGRGARASYKNKSKKRPGVVVPMWGAGQLDVLHGESGLKAA